MARTKKWYQDKQNITLLTGLVSTVLTSINIIMGFI